jgi:hypothetical protein
MMARIGVGLAVVAAILVVACAPTNEPAWPNASGL